MDIAAYCSARQITCPDMATFVSHWQLPHMITALAIDCTEKSCLIKTGIRVYIFRHDSGDATKQYPILATFLRDCLYPACPALLELKLSDSCTLQAAGVPQHIQVLELGSLLESVDLQLPCLMDIAHIIITHMWVLALPHFTAQTTLRSVTIRNIECCVSAWETLLQHIHIAELILENVALVPEDPELPWDIADPNLAAEYETTRPWVYRVGRTILMEAYQQYNMSALLVKSAAKR